MVVLRKLFLILAVFFASLIFLVHCFDIDEKVQYTDHTKLNALNILTGLKGERVLQEHSNESYQYQQQIRRKLQYTELDDVTKKIERYPKDKEAAPYTDNNRILGMVLMYNFGHIDGFMLGLLPEYISMCEGGWNPSIVIFTTSFWSPIVRRVIREKSHCYRINHQIDIKWSVFPKNISISLAQEHRKYMKKKINDYDLFLYHEDDIPFKYSHVQAFITETNLLKKRLPWSGLYKYIIGFQRYRWSHKPSNTEVWGETDILEQQLLEETPLFQTHCLSGEDIHVNPYEHPRAENIQYNWEGKGVPYKKMNETTGSGSGTKRRLRTRVSTDTATNTTSTSTSTSARAYIHTSRKEMDGDWDNKVAYPYIQVTGNTHTGAFMMTQEQVKIADIKCNFLSHTSPSREFMSSFSIFDNGKYTCGYKKLIPANNFQSFLIHHSYDSKFSSWYTTASVNDKTRSGKAYNWNGKLNNHPCWNPIFDKMTSVLENEKHMLKVGELPWDAQIE
jgi:hypothetical protein